MAKYKVLSTKRLLDSLVKQAKENDIEIIEKEFIYVEPIITEEKVKEVLDLAHSDKEYIAFTSANGVHPFKKYLHYKDNYYVAGWKIFCLAGKTKEELSESYAKLIGEIIDTAEDARTLAQKIIRSGVKEIIFFCGNKRRDELPSILKNAGLIVHEVTVYNTHEMPTMITDEIDGILFFSPSAVNSFFSVNQLKKNTVCFAIGQTSADVLSNFTDNKIIVSEFPSQEKMMASVNIYFKNETS